MAASGVFRNRKTTFLANCFFVSCNVVPQCVLSYQYFVAVFTSIAAHIVNSFLVFPKLGLAFIIAPTRITRKRLHYQLTTN